LVFLFELFAKINGLGYGGIVRKGALDAELEFVDLERLFEVIEGALLHRLFGRINGAKTGNNDHHGGRS
jgi:hypothetical protein